MPRHEFKHLRLMLSLFRVGNTLNFMICSPSFSFFRQSMNLGPFLKCFHISFFQAVFRWEIFEILATQIQKWKQWKRNYTQIANWTDAKLTPNKLFPIWSIWGQISVFRAKFPYFEPNVAISGQMSLFRGKITLNSDRISNDFGVLFLVQNNLFFEIQFKITGPKQLFWHSKINRNLTIFKFWGLKGGPKNLRFLKFRPRI